MRSGVSVESRAAEATFAPLFSSGDVNYPAQNLADLETPSKVARFTPQSGSIGFTAILPTSRYVEFVAVVAHNVPADARLQLAFFKDNNPSLANAAGMIFNTGVIGFWELGAPGGKGPWTRPYRVEPRLNVRSAYVAITNLPAGQIDIGGFEISRFWEWPGIGYGQDVGFEHRAEATVYAGGAAVTPPSKAPRMRAGEVILHMSETATKGIDHQRRMGLGKAFVFVDDLEDSTTWARHCFLAHNREVPPAVGLMYRHDTFPLRLVEHLK